MLNLFQHPFGREKQLKRWHRQWKIELIESENPDWHDLAPGLGVPPLAPSGRLDGPRIKSGVTKEG